MKITFNTSNWYKHAVWPPQRTQLNDTEIHEIYDLLEHMTKWGPDRFDMDKFFGRSFGNSKYTSEWAVHDRDLMAFLDSECGTTACLAGHYWIVNGAYLPINDTAARLGMGVCVPDDAPHGTTGWFYPQFWPVWACDGRSTYDVILGVMDDLVHGRRLHWYDNNLAADLPEATT